MKAVLLAGGAGTRLRPISAETPKPMVKLFDKPVMEYSIELLRNHGFGDITVTLQTMPQKIIDHFGDGGGLGVRLRYSVEQTPLGTAGGLKAALGGGSITEPFAVMSGDAVCDFDLAQALRFHKQRGGHVTLLLSKQKKLLDYGLVMTDSKGGVLRFIEKPGWGQVFTDMVNTGIYILSPEVLQLIPDGTPFDFAKDLFPLMLDRGMGVYGYEAEGYWCDIGDSEAYMRCCRDVLDGRLRLSLPPSQTPPANCIFTPPCYIGANVGIGANTHIGPYAVVGGGSQLQDRCSVEFSVLDGAVLETGARCEGAYLGRGTVLGKGAAAREGCVVGSGCKIGAGAVLTEGVRLWPRKEIGEGARVSAHIERDIAFRNAVFDDNGQLRGRLNIDLTPEFNMRLGAAAAAYAREAPENSGEVAVAWQGGHAARLCAHAISLGVDSCGGRTVQSDALTPAAAAFAGGMYRIPLSIFVKQNDDALALYVFGRDGLYPGHEEARKLEAAVLRGDTSLGTPMDIRPIRSMSGTQDLYARHGALPPSWVRFGHEPVALRVAGSGSAAETLRRALLAAGCVSAGPVLEISDDGLELRCTLENGEVLDTNRLQGMMLMVEAALGSREIALPASAPRFLEQFAEEQGVVILREGRDGAKARSLLCDQPFMRDMLFLAARLAHGLRRLGADLGALNRRLPGFFVAEGEIPLAKDRGEIMRALVSALPGAELYEGFFGRHKNGWIHIAPLPSRRALKIAAEGLTMEAANEIFADFSQLTTQLDSGKDKPSAV